MTEDLGGISYSLTPLVRTGRWLRDLVLAMCPVHSLLLSHLYLLLRSRPT